MKIFINIAIYNKKQKLICLTILYQIFGKVILQSYLMYGYIFKDI
jgi:hypothetical protein